MYHRLGFTENVCFDTYCITLDIGIFGYYSQIFGMNQPIKWIHCLLTCNKSIDAWSTLLQSSDEFKLWLKIQTCSLVELTPFGYYPRWVKSKSVLDLRLCVLFPLLGLPDAVPARYTALRDVSLPAIRTRLRLLHHFSDLIYSSWRLLNLNPAQVSILLPLWKSRS